MGPLKFNFRDIFRSPRMALSGKKIFIFIQGNLFGYIVYWLCSYIALEISQFPFQESLSKYGLYPCLFGNDAEWYSWVVYYIGIGAWLISILLSSTAVSRITLKQLKGNDFFSGRDAWTYVQKHWHAVVFSPIAIFLIIFSFILFAVLFALVSSIPYIGEFIFVIPYILYFFGSVFTIYTFVVLIIAIFFTPSIVGVYEEDTMGTVFHSYSITFGQIWRIILYHLLLFSLVMVGIEIFSWFCFNAIGFINYIFGLDWLMADKLININQYACSLVCPDWICKVVYSAKCCVMDWLGIKYNIPYLFSVNCNIPITNLSTTESITAVILGLSYFIIGFAIISYGFSIISVGETLMFIIFKKKSDDDDLLQRKDEDEIEDEDEMEDEGFNANPESDKNIDKNKSSEIEKPSKPD